MSNACLGVRRHRSGRTRHARAVCLAAFLTTAALLLGGGCGPEAAEPSGPAHEEAEPVGVLGAELTHSLFVSPEARAKHGGIAALRVQSAGSVQVPTGHLATSDAYANQRSLRVPSIPPGSYAVELLIASTPREERVAAARVVVSRETPVRWIELGELEVESGAAAFFDSSVAASLHDESLESFVRALMAGFKADPRLARIAWRDANVVAFASGYGEGRYPASLGISASGEVAAVLIDFVLLPWPDWSS